jgi:hypothetical protein
MTKDQGCLDGEITVTTVKVIVYWAGGVRKAVGGADRE